MGWKNIRTHYDIKHYVRVEDKGICIGSPYIHDIIIVSPTGRILKGLDKEFSVYDLGRYVRDIVADPQTFARLFAEPDQFERSLPVYTYEDGEILTKYCEEYGFPNVTHDGAMMYDNLFFKDLGDALKSAKIEAESAVRLCTQSFEEATRQLERASVRLTTQQAHLDRLIQTYPELADECFSSDR
ncbi:hypothetical protein [Thalassospira xiamenensis]|uniref:Uncharacterized protein n=1 Tax=Thalassospira xiamenensis TaxID=220697 RepID=A0A285TRU5_9PROT|nr:hypothetical protein [Thalassospira xiamenensis]SOC26234.1 hypothetical protein SAMN05428964_10584 [Thalassospira xiamenensis]